MPSRTHLNRKGNYMMYQSNRRSWKAVLIALVAVLSITLLAGCGNKDNSEGKTDTNKETNAGGAVVATYEGGEITAAQFDLDTRIISLFNPQVAQLVGMEYFQEFFLKQTIAYYYLSEQADDTARAEGKKLSKETIADIKKQMGEDGFKSMLASQNVTEDEFSAYMDRVNTVVKSETAKVTEDDMKKFYVDHKQEFTIASVRHILIGLTDAEGKERTAEDALKIAKDVKSQLDNGGDFAELAAKYSEDPGSNEEGGLYENEKVSKWVDAFQEKAVTLPLNQISDPVETEMGYHIMRVEARTEYNYDELSETQLEELKSLIGASKMDEFLQTKIDDIIKSITLPKAEGEADGANPGNADTNAGTNADNGQTTDPTQSDDGTNKTEDSK